MNKPKRLTGGQFFVDVTNDSKEVQTFVFDTKEELETYIRDAVKVGTKIVSRGEY